MTRVHLATAAALDSLPAPQLVLGHARAFVLGRSVWDELLLLRTELQAPTPPRYLHRAAEVPPAAPGRQVWVEARTTTWTTVPERSARHLYLAALARRWRERGVYLVELDATAPRCRACGCVDELACPGGCAWATKVPRICSTCLRIRVAGRCA